MQEVRDESRMVGWCETIQYPQTIEEIQKLIETCRKSKQRITIAGGKTGIAGGCIPQGGYLLCTEKYKNIRLEGEDKVTVSAGVTLEELQIYLRKNHTLYFAPNPTEKTATLCGLFACNGAGGNRRKHGTVANNVEAITVVNGNGECMNVQRGECLEWGVDIIDLFSGSEGQLGIVTDITLKLKQRESLLALMAFFESEEEALAYIQSLQQWEYENNNQKIIEECEFFDAKTLGLLEQKKKSVEQLKWVPDFPEGLVCGIYVILSSNDDERLENTMMELYERYLECGGKDEYTWGLEGLEEVEKLYKLRHCVPELLNAKLDKYSNQSERMEKMGTDFTVDKSFIEYKKEIAKDGIEGYIFGHCLDNHYHIDLFPHTLEEKEIVQKLLEGLYQEVKEKEGLVVTENGVGQLKQSFVSEIISEKTRIERQRMKSYFDSDGILGKSMAIWSGEICI
ncbi:FAD-binding oxidoreductase [Clostridium sp. CS001]|uniref:FAD-binding oxidoreductase n=1 Tax=Clostridium sp. CS001 TaxID=2880648 RepID=UPI001CF1DCAE|nr:FAD-binding oxidoreductase [Clostridium sp. CS001]MCB2289852.1 FAD-binding oxidoreductase [Clostridium sp. CS001]